MGTENEARETGLRESVATVRVSGDDQEKDAATDCVNNRVGKVKVKRKWLPK